MKGRYVVQISPADVGRRVTVRSRLASTAEGGPTTTDVVGVLEWWRDARLAIRRRDGSLATVAVDDVLAARVIPDRPPRSSPYT